MPEPSNDDIWGKGSIGVKGSQTEHTVTIEVHFCTAILNIHESLWLHWLLTEAINKAAGHEAVVHYGVRQEEVGHG